jgi:hypothetical protein
MALKPEVSFTHTLAEIAVNRADPCELARELISNSYDAGASNIRVYALAERHGLLFFDDGTGLSRDEEDRKNGILPYVAFFSIGKGTKTHGDGIGYKCQGSKLCFASQRFTLITRVENDTTWWCKTIDNPKINLTDRYELDPDPVDEPWEFLKHKVLNGAGARTRQILDSLDEKFFREKFQHGTMLVIEEFETDDYDQYFSTNTPNNNYLYQYIRLHTAHGDCRSIRKSQGFRQADILAVSRTVQQSSKAKTHLYLWVAESGGVGRLEEVPAGWMYLDTEGDSFDASPAEVTQLRSGRFFSRHAAPFKHGSEYFSVILAIDGNRRALDRYPGLARRGGSNSGLKLSHTRGALLSSRGIVIGSYPQLWNLPGLGDSAYGILAEGTDHYTLIVDGPFDLVTNRDAPAPSASLILKDARFAQHIRTQLEQFERSKEGSVLTELIQRLNRETTRHREDAYLEANRSLREDMGLRERFTVRKVAVLSEKVFYSPLSGEEHFVGALYTLFSHLVSVDHPLREFWPRPLTFSSRGIDAIAVKDETRPMTNGNIESVEYKYFFSASDEFNHPLNITNAIICWDFEDPEPGTQVRDSYNYLSTVSDAIRVKFQKSMKVVGFSLSGVQHANEVREFPHTVRVLSLRRLLTYTFDAEFKKPTAKKK